MVGEFKEVSSPPFFGGGWGGSSLTQAYYLIISPRTWKNRRVSCLNSAAAYLPTPPNKKNLFRQLSIPKLLILPSCGCNQNQQKTPLLSKFPSLGNRNL